MAIVFDFWDRAARAYRFDDGTRQACGRRRRRDAVPRSRAARSSSSARPVDDERLAHVTRLNALLTSYLFLLWFDTRSGYQDTGPVPARRRPVLLLRAFNGLGPSHFPWSADGRERDAVHRRARRVRARRRRPARHRLRHVGDRSRGLPHARRRVRAVRRERRRRRSRSTTTAPTRSRPRRKAAQRQLYRTIAGMERRAKIDAGAYVYFTFLRPFAELAGVELDWTVPRDSLDLYPLLELVDGALPGPVVEETPETYYENSVNTIPGRARDDGSRRRRARRTSRARRAGGGRRGTSTPRPTTASACRCASRARPRSVSRGGGRTSSCPTCRARSSCATTRCRCPRQGLEVRADGLWGELMCETPLEHWSYGLEAFGVALDDPATRCAARSASACRSASTSNGRSSPTPTRRTNGRPAGRSRLRADRQRARRGAARPLPHRARCGRLPIAYVG